jgi:hypothetical protein
MAKALLGHVDDGDHLLLAEVRRLERRLADLEARLARLCTDSDLPGLSAASGPSAATSSLPQSTSRVS